VEQFKIFIDKIEPGGLLIYNDSDKTLRDVINKHRRADIKYQPYGLPTYFIEDGKTEIILEGQKTALKIFGNHNLLNLHAAFFVCKQLGITALEFGAAVANFSGAAKRLEVISSTSTSDVYRDFAHAPSKVKASIEAVKQQFPKRRLVSILELHTYSSLNENFMKEYKGAMDQADVAIVFYSKHALELKRMPPLSKEKIKEGFGKDNLMVFTNKKDVENWLQHHEYSETNLLLMSSGNYEGLDLNLVLAKKE
jgi:UDP-N-acetylmuramate: L-alanyl-gamma-D-glutamyl-meso-diaminopimelate ligase